MSQDVAAVVLAAGQGTRFRSDVAKVLHRAAGRTLIGHVLEALRPLQLGQVVVVVGHQADDVRDEIDSYSIEGLTTVLQADQRGTGHAVQQAVPALRGDIRRVLVLPGDTPLLAPATLTAVVDAGAGHDAVLGVAELDDPSGYGRVLRDDAGAVTAIVEHRDATAEQLATREVNAGIYLFDRQLLEGALHNLDDDNEQQELYLTDVVATLTGGGHEVAGVVVAADEIAGVNDRRQLAEAAAVLRRRWLEHLMVEVGVTVVDPAATYLDVGTQVGRDTVLLPGTMLAAGTRVGSHATIGPNSHLTGCDVGDGAVVHSTRATDTVIGEGASVGPFAHLRAGTVLGVGTKAGAFVETKNATFAEGAKASHLAYVGDATIGRDVNVGCGVVVVNYDGRAKHHTTVEDGAFVGSGTMLIAPVTIGDSAYVAAGSTITDDVPAEALAIARARQVIKEGWVSRQSRP